MEGEKNMTTMDKPLDQVLKEDILEDIVQEASAIKVYGKIAGINCIGRSYFYDKKEVVDKYQWAQQQMTNKYGAEMYGSSAQLRDQSANRSDGNGNDGTGTGTSSGNASPLINCTVSPLMKLPQKFINEGAQDFSQFWKPFEKFIHELQDCIKDDSWPLKNDAIQIVNLSRKFNQGSGPTSKDNTEPYQAIVKIIEKREWEAFLKGEGKTIGDLWKQAAQGWQAWSGKQSSGKSGETSKLSSGEILPDTWNPYQACRIDIHTNFDANWFKRKFKSGLLNKLIFAIKTDARSRLSDGAKARDPMANHKYTADEMLPQDTKKLDKIQWKMTNKAARDFITYFMGWTRKKERMPDSKDGVAGPPTEQLQYDEQFGSEMADAALSNRGLLGRLKQKIFSGGQSNNVISVAFQMADPNDDWTVVEEDADGELEPEEANEEPTEQAEDDSGIGENEINDVVGLFQRVQNVERAVFKESMDESTDKMVEDVILGYLES